MKRLAIVFLLGWLGAAPVVGAQTSAPNPKYEIEVLIFEMRIPEFEGSELWTRTEQLAETADQTKAENALPTTAAAFPAAAAALQADGRYRVLLQKRWVQNADAKSNVPTISLATANKELDGTFKFYLSRFLHIDLNVFFQTEATAIGSDAAPNYVINEQRRIKSNDTHYFDHPKFGVLVKVSPTPG